MSAGAARVWVEGGGGVRLAARLAGPEGAPAILFLHGWSQHSLAWQKQLGGPLAERFRLAAIDLRGHGASDAPPEPHAYLSSELWAGDVAGAIRDLGLGPTLLVGWSMGAWVAADHLRHAGASGLTGLVLVGASARARAAPTPQTADGPPDQAREIAEAVAFAKAMTAAPLSKRDLASVVAWQMLTPAHVRAACRAREDDWRDDLTAADLPALVIRGAADRVSPKPAHDELMAALARPVEAIYPGAGHMPFWEVPARFDADLAAFADTTLAAGR